MDVSEVRRRVRAAIEQARRETAERRSRIDAASRDYEHVLTSTAIPIFQLVAGALTGEGHRFSVNTPAGSVRLVSDRAAETYAELSLDVDRDLPAVVIRTSRGRGRRMVTTERAIREGMPVGDITENDVLTVLVEEIVPLIA